MPEAQKIIFSNSYSPRTGHNFVSEVIRTMTNHEVLIHPKSETRLSAVLASIKKIEDRLIFFQTDKDFMRYMFLDGLRERILEKSDRPYVFIKDTNFNGTDLLREVFPNDIHVLVLRDPFDVFISIFKAMKIKGSPIKKVLKRILLPLGIYPYFYARKVSNRVLKLIPEMSKFYIIRYEDLVMRNQDVIRDMMVLFNSHKNLEEVIKEIDKIKVINTSFYNETGGRSIWDAHPISKGFNPVNRGSKNILINFGIKLGSKRLSKKLGY